MVKNIHLYNQDRSAADQIENDEESSAWQGGVLGSFESLAAAIEKKSRHRALFLSHFHKAGLPSLTAMQCDYCDSKATVFFTQIIDGNTNKSCLCEMCATKHGVTDPEGFLLGGMNLSGEESPTSSKMPKFQVPMGNETIILPVQDIQPTSGSGICPGCGFAFDDLKKTGRLGCSQCYQFFRTEIKNNLGGMHKGTSHTGRVPEGMLNAFKNRKQLEQLQSEMDQAIRDEDYEKAAALRDEMKKLSEETAATPNS